MLARRRLLVTGAGGFIGSHLVEAAVASGARVRAFMRYTSQGSRGWLDELDASTLREIEVLAGDVRDAPTVDRVVKGADVVLHLAALVGIPYSYEAPEAYVATNLLGTLNVLEACRRHAIRRVVITSTSEVYGTAQYAPIDERHPLRPQSPYAASKVAADQLALAYHASFQTPVVILRPFNTYGPRQSLRAVIPTIAVQLLAGVPVRLGSLAPTRDFTYVADTVAGFLRAATASGIEGRTIQLGTGEERSVGEIATALAEIVGVSLHIERDDARVRPAESEVERLVADAALARELLGWRPEVALREGLERTVAWIAAREPSRRAGEYAR